MAKPTAQAFELSCMISSPWQALCPCCTMTGQENPARAGALGSDSAEFRSLHSMEERLYGGKIMLPQSGRNINLASSLFEVLQDIP